MSVGERFRAARNSPRVTTGEVIAMAKKARTSKALGTVANRLPDARTDAPRNMTEHDIARRAYELYLARDGEHGHDLYDWLQAERELRERT